MNYPSGASVVAPAVLGTSLAMTGYAFGAYIVLAAVLILAGIVLRRLAMGKTG